MYDLVCFLGTRLTCSNIFSTFNLYLGIVCNLVDFTNFNYKLAGHDLDDLGREKNACFTFLATRLSFTVPK